MKHLPMKKTDNSIHYTLHGDYYFPDLELPEASRQTIGRYGRMQKAYLEEHRPGLYARLILSGKLHEHLAEIDACCSERMGQMILRTATRECINEELKASDQLAWAGRMNSIRQQAEEIILNELIHV